MFITRPRGFALASLTSLALLAACGGTNDTKPPAPTGFTVTPGDGRVTVNWNSDPNLTYWVFSAQGVGVTRDNYRTFPDPRITVPVQNGGQIVGLTNGLTYSFFVNASEGNGPGGPETGTLTAVPTISGTTWKTGPLGSGTGDLRSIGAAYGRLLAVGTGGALFSCPLQVQPCSWVQSAAPAGAGSPTLYSSAFNTTLSRTVVVGDAVGGNASIWTNDGSTTDSTLTTWTARANTVDATLRAVTTSGTGFVAVGDNGRVATSTDGVTWTTYRLQAPASGSAIWTASTSTNCSVAPNCSINLNSLVYFNGTYFATGDNGTVMTSPDAVSWHKQTINDASGSASTATLHALNYSSTYLRYVIVGEDAAGASGKIYTSPDAVTWTEQVVAGLPPLNTLVLGSRFVALGAGGQPWISTDAISGWSASGLSGYGPSRIYSAIWSYGEYVGVGANNTIQWSYHPPLQ